MWPAGPPAIANAHMDAPSMPRWTLPQYPYGRYTQVVRWTRQLLLDGWSRADTRSR